MAVVFGVKSGWLAEDGLLRAGRERPAGHYRLSEDAGEITCRRGRPRGRGSRSKELIAASRRKNPDLRVRFPMPAACPRRKRFYICVLMRHGDDTVEPQCRQIQF